MQGSDSGQRVRPRFGRTIIVLAVALLVPALGSCGGAAAPQRAPQPVIVDTDMASDDIMALSYLLQRHDISVKAITVEGVGEAHGPAGARNALRLMRALGIRRSIPVAYGPQYPISGFRSFPPDWRTTADGMYNLGLPAWSGPQPSGSAVRLLTDTISRSGQPVEVITLGPLTNLALALRTDPGVAGKIKMIYSMAGAVRVNGNEPVHQRAEWNVYVDAAAANRVLRSGVPITMVPLDASNNAPVTTLLRDTVQAHPKTAALRIVGTMLRDSYYTQTGSYFWDPLAAVAATDHDQNAVRLLATRLTIDSSGGPDMGVTRMGTTGTPVRVAVSASGSAFERQFLATLDGGRPITIPSPPVSQRLRVIFNGTSYDYHGPSTATAGQLQVRLTNSSPAALNGFQLVIGKLAAGRSMADVQQVIREGNVTSIPAWFQVAALLPGATGADAAWSVTLSPGRYALVCQQDRDSALSAVTVLTIR
jgi:inosine-uridine nucleoside N-ribohydrolase